MGEGREDRFANVAAGEVVMSAANALTFTELLTGVSLGQGVGMLIDQIDYYPTEATAAEMATSADALVMGVTTSNDLTDLDDYKDRRIVHVIRSEIQMTTSGAVYMKWPEVAQFFPPLILAAPRLYLAVDTSAYAAAATVRFRIYFRYVSLTPQQYLELAEAFLLVG